MQREQNTCYRCNSLIHPDDEIGVCQQTWFGYSLPDKYYHAEGCQRASEKRR